MSAHQAQRPGSSSVGSYPLKRTDSKSILQEVVCGFSSDTYTLKQRNAR